MQHQFVGEPEAVTRHYGIRSAIFAGAVAVHTVVLLNRPDHAVLSLVNRSAAEQYCRDLERDVFGYDEAVQK